MNNFAILSASCQTPKRGFSYFTKLAQTGALRLKFEPLVSGPFNSRRSLARHLRRAADRVRAVLSVSAPRSIFSIGGIAKAHN
jgi:hypothetical protein